MSQRLGGWWRAGVLLPLVLSGLVLMHTVDVGDAGGQQGHKRAAVVAADASIEMHGGTPHRCDDCDHIGLHVTTACAAMLGSIAVWSLARRLARRAAGPVASLPTTSGRPAPRQLLVRLRPPWVELGVMLC